MYRQWRKLESCGNNRPIADATISLPEGTAHYEEGNRSVTRQQKRGMRVGFVKQPSPPVYDHCNANMSHLDRNN